MPTLKENGIPKKAPLVIKPENITFYDIEINDAFDYGALTPEEVTEIQQANADFEAKVLQPELMGRAHPCVCMQEKIMERAITRMKLTNQQPVNGQIPVELTQEDIDMKQFGVVVNTANGRYDGILAILSRCKGCSDIRIWGTIEPLTAMVAMAFNDYMNRQPQRVAVQQALDEREQSDIAPDGDDTAPVVEPNTTADGPMFMLENTETGEKHAADNLGEALFGGGNSEFKMTEANGKE